MDDTAASKTPLSKGLNQHHSTTDTSALDNNNQ